MLIPSNNGRRSRICGCFGMCPDGDLQSDRSSSPAFQAALANCHLLIEKPLSHSLESCDELDLVRNQRQLSWLVSLCPLQGGFERSTPPGVWEIFGAGAEWAVFARLASGRISRSYSSRPISVEESFCFDSPHRLSLRLSVGEGVRQPPGNQPI